MALEAITELNSECKIVLKVHSYSFRNISVREALVIPRDDKGIETLLTMRLPYSRSRKIDRVDAFWWTFTISSVDDDGVYIKHIEGDICLNIRKCKSHR